MGAEFGESQSQPGGHLGRHSFTHKEQQAQVWSQMQSTRQRNKKAWNLQETNMKSEREQDSRAIRGINQKGLGPRSSKMEDMTVWMLSTP